MIFRNQYAHFRAVVAARISGVCGRGFIVLLITVAVAGAIVARAAVLRAVVPHTIDNKPGALDLLGPSVPPQATAEQASEILKPHGTTAVTGGSKPIPTTDGTTVQLGDAWWVYAYGDWIRVGKPIPGHAYAGFEVWGGGRLTDVIDSLRREFKSDRSHHVKAALARGLNPKLLVPGDVELLQRIADAESYGQVACVSTYDNQVVSFGLRQWTLGSGRLQNLIRENASSFAKYGIRLSVPTGADDGCWTIAGRRVQRIDGVQSPEELTGPYWTAKFFKANLDPAIISYTIRLAARELYQDSTGAATGLNAALSMSPLFHRSARARALIAELENNRPGYTPAVVSATIAEAKQQPHLDDDQLVRILVQDIARPYEEEFTRKAMAAAGDPDDTVVRLAAAKAAGDHFAGNWMGSVLGMSGFSLGEEICQVRLAREAAAQPAFVASGGPAPATGTSLTPAIAPAPGPPASAPKVAAHALAKSIAPATVRDAAIRAAGAADAARAADLNKEAERLATRQAEIQAEADNRLAQRRAAAREAIRKTMEQQLSTAGVVAPHMSVPAPDLNNDPDSSSTPTQLGK